MKILIAIETITPGGAEWFALRTARALQEDGHEVRLWVMRPDFVDGRLIEKFSDIKREGLNPLISRQLVRADSLAGRAGLEERFVRQGNIMALRKFIRSFQPDAIHSHLFKTDWAVTEANKGTGITVVTTIHGDYLNFYYKQPETKRASYAEKLKAVLKSIQYIATISERQLRFFLDVLKISPEKLKSIYNGYPVDGKNLDAPGKTDNITRFGMIARGIPDKGWAIAIEAFNKAAIQNSELLLVGESDYLTALKENNKNQNIHFKAFTTNPLQEIQKFDIGLLPSWYASESLPTTVIEYMALGKPTIATDIGEVANMLGTPDGTAGIIIPLQENHDAMAADLREAMIRLASDQHLYADKVQRAYEAFKKFKMEACIEEYMMLYKNATK